MLRRDFIGSVIGSMIATRVPYIAKRRLLGGSVDDNLLFAQLLHYSPELLDFHYTLTSGERIHTTPLVEIDKEYSGGELVQAVVILTPWQCDVDKLVIEHLGTSYLGRDIKTTRLSVGTLNRGDRLRCNYTINLEGFKI